LLTSGCTIRSFRQAFRDVSKLSDRHGRYGGNVKRRASEVNRARVIRISTASCKRRIVDVDALLSASPPLDCRKAGPPVDCRVSPPLNSPHVIRFVAPRVRLTSPEQKRSIGVLGAYSRRCLAYAAQPHFADLTVRYQAEE
jgi:hypothetical protein